jgi:hypothetical protein
MKNGAVAIAAAVFKIFNDTGNGFLLCNDIDRLCDNSKSSDDFKSAPHSLKTVCTPNK